MPMFPLSSPSYSQQATRFDVACGGETVTNSPLTLLIMFAAADEAGGVGSECLNDPSELVDTCFAGTAERFNYLEVRHAR
jgi:hypothetical protein